MLCCFERCATLKSVWRLRVLSRSCVAKSSRRRLSSGRTGRQGWDAGNEGGSSTGGGDGAKLAQPARHRRRMARQRRGSPGCFGHGRRWRRRRSGGQQHWRGGSSDLAQWWQEQSSCGSCSDGRRIGEGRSRGVLPELAGGGAARRRWGFTACTEGPVAGAEASGDWVRRRRNRQGWQQKESTTGNRRSRDDGDGRPTEMTGGSSRICDQGGWKGAAGFGKSVGVADLARGDQGGDPVKGLAGGGRRTAWWRATVASDSSEGSQQQTEVLEMGSVGERGGDGRRAWEEGLVVTNGRCGSRGW